MEVQSSNITITEEEFGYSQEVIKKLSDYFDAKVVGQQQLKFSLIGSILADGHILIESVPGLAKTTAAKAISDAVDGKFARIQCTPDTMPSDITGISVYSKNTGTFSVMPGPVLNHIVLADELNRTSPKTQSALLEVMEEHKITIDGVSYDVPEPFMVVGTQNPSEMAGTYPLPESQLDRFMMKLSVGYPEIVASEEMAKRFLEGSLHEKTLAVLTGKDILDNVLCRKSKHRTDNRRSAENGLPHGLRSAECGYSKNDEEKYVTLKIKIFSIIKKLQTKEILVGIEILRRKKTVITIIQETVIITNVFMYVLTAYSV